MLYGAGILVGKYDRQLEKFTKAQDLGIICKVVFENAEEKKKVHGEIMDNSREQILGIYLLEKWEEKLKKEQKQVKAREDNIGKN